MRTTKDWKKITCDKCGGEIEKDDDRMVLLEVTKNNDKIKTRRVAHFCITCFDVVN